MLRKEERLAAARWYGSKQQDVVVAAVRGRSCRYFD